MVIHVFGKRLLLVAFMPNLLFAGCKSAAENPSVVFLTEILAEKSAVFTDTSEVESGPADLYHPETAADGGETEDLLVEDISPENEAVKDIHAPDIDINDKDFEAAIPHCESDDDCDPLVCDLESGECVECLEDEDCGDGMFCHDNECEGQVCVPLEFFCEGIEIHQCNDAGSGSEFVLTCDDDIDCTIDACFDGECSNKPSSPSCCVPECGEGLECKDFQCTCKPDCSDKECGSDGCGGSCGECKKQYKCSSGKCLFNCPLCPYLPGCYMNDWMEHAYYLCYDYRNWKESEAKCKEFGAHLVTINSQAENAFLTSFAENNSVWIGLYESWWKWYWVTGEPVSFKNWAPGEPNDGDIWTIEDCGMMYPNGQWNDEECWTDLMFICEFEP